MHHQDKRILPIVLLYCFIVFTLTNLHATAENINDRTKLFMKILENKTQNKLILPKLSNNSVNVTVSLHEFKIYKINSKELQASYSTNFQLTWKDPRLSWKPEEYGNIRIMIVPMTDIWIPDILPLFGKHDDFITNRDGATNIDSDGQVTFIRKIHSQLFCNLDDNFDDKNSKISNERFICSEKFLSWNYNENYIHLQLTDVEMFTVTEVNNADWQLITGTASRNEAHYECCPEIYSDIFVKIILECKERQVLPVFVMVRVTSLLGFVSFKNPDTRIKLLFLFIMVASLLVMITNSDEQKIQYKKEMKICICLAMGNLIWSIIASNFIYFFSETDGTKNKESSALVIRRVFDLLSIVFLLPKRSTSNKISLEEEVNVTYNSQSIREIVILIVDRMLAVVIFVIVIVIVFTQSFVEAI